MKIGTFILAVFVLSACFSIQGVRAQNGDMVSNMLKTYLSKYMDNPQFQLNFLKDFIKGMIIGEIRLYDLALNHANKLGSEQTKKIHEEVNGFISILFHEKFTSLEDLIKDIQQNNPSALQGHFNEDTFKDDIKHFNYQELLASAIVNKLLVEHGTDKEKITEAYKNLDSIKTFLVKYRGVKEEDIEKAFAIIKNPTVIKKSVESLLEKVNTPEFRNAMMKLYIKLIEFQKEQKDDVDILSLLLDDKALLKLLDDQDWESVLKLKELATKAGGKVYEDYYKDFKNGGSNVDEDEEEEEDEDDEKKKSMSAGKIFLIVIGIASVILIAFVIYRKYNQDKYNDGSYADDKRLYKNTV